MRKFIKDINNNGKIAYPAKESSRSEAGKALKYRQTSRNLLFYWGVAINLVFSFKLNRMMKTFFTASLVSLLVISGEAFSQLKLPKLLTKNSASSITENEAGQGIKEALTQGVTNAVLNLNKTDGFFGSEVGLQHFKRKIL